MVGALGVVHIALGSDPLIPALAIFTMALGIWPLARFGLLNIGALLVFLVAFRHVGFPLFAKLAMGQALDSHLDQPLAAFGAVAAGVSAYLGALVIADKVKSGAPILKPITDPRMLRRLSYTAFAVGFGANVEWALRVGSQTDALNVSIQFTQFLHLALIAASASALLRSDKHRIMDLWVLIIFATEVVFAIIQNYRASILEAFLCLVTTVVAFRGTVGKKQIASALAGFLLLMYITPVMLHVRSMREQLPWYARIDATVEALKHWDEAHAAFLAFLDKIFNLSRQVKAETLKNLAL